MNTKNLKLLNGKYGLELESIYTVPQNERTRFGSLPKSKLLAYKTDGSINVSEEEYQDEYDESGAERGQRRSVEVVTRPRKLSSRNLTTLDNFLKVYRKEYNGRVNRSTGLHLHLGHGEVSALTCGRMNNIIFTMQKALQQIVPRSRATNQYCKPLDLINFNECTDQRECLRNAIAEKYYIVSWRYNSINSNVSRQSIAHGNHVEIRMHSGTLNIEKIKHWVILWTNIIEYAYSIASDINRYNTYFATIIDRMTNGTSEQARTAGIVFSTDNQTIRTSYNQLGSDSKLFLSLSELLHITNIPPETKAFYYDRRNELLAIDSERRDTDTTITASELVATLKGITTAEVTEPDRVIQVRESERARLAALKALQQSAIEKVTTRMRTIIKAFQTHLPHLQTFLGTDGDSYEPGTYHIMNATTAQLSEQGPHMQYHEREEMSNIFGNLMIINLFARHFHYNHDPYANNMTRSRHEVLEMLWRASDTELTNICKAMNWLQIRNNNGYLYHNERYTVKEVLCKIQEQQSSPELSTASSETATVVPC